MSTNRGRQGVTTAHHLAPSAIALQGDEEFIPPSMHQTFSRQPAALPLAVPSGSRSSNGIGRSTGSLGDGGTVAGRKQEAEAFHRLEVVGRFGKGSGDSQGFLTENQQTAMGKALQCVFGTRHPFRFVGESEAEEGDGNVGETAAGGGTRS